MAEKIEENEETFDDEGNLDIDIKEVEKKYKEIINRPDIIEASEKLNLFFKKINYKIFHIFEFYN